MRATTSPRSLLLSDLSATVRRLLGRTVRFDHLAPWSEATDDDRAAFDAYALEWTAHLGVMAPLFVLACLLLWWPVDALVGPTGRFVEAMSVMRSVSIVVLLAIVVAFQFSHVVQRHAFLSATIAYAVSMATVGYCLGRMGGDDLSWLGDAYIAVLPAAAMPMGLGRRIAAMIVIVGALPAAFFLPHPANWSAPAASGQLSFAGFAMALSIIVGDVLQRTVRRSFFQGRSILRARAEVAALADSLAERVAEQTDELRTLATHLERVQEAERRRLSRDLHDELGQDLTAMRYTLELGERRLAERPSSAPELLDQLSALLRRTTTTVRTLIMGLRPRLLEDQGLGAAIELIATRARESEIAVDVIIEPGAEHGLSPEALVALYRCAQEAATNTLRHADANHLRIELRREGEHVVVAVADDGIGITAGRNGPGADPARPHMAGFGIIGIRERLRAVGGTLTVEPGDRGGTRLLGRVPVGPIVRPSQEGHP